MEFEMDSLFVTFVILNIVNVILQTVKSLATVNCGKWVASIVNAVTFGVYTVVIVYTVCELPLAVKVIVVSLCNLVGVFVVKLIEEKTRKDQLWKVELTVNNSQTEKLAKELDTLKIPNNYIDHVGKYTIFNIYCATQKESTLVKEIANRHNAKYFVSESKVL